MAEATVPVWMPDLVGPGGQALRERRNSSSDDRTRGTRRPTHVLLIEDDAAISEMYRVQLEYDGYRVTIAANGEHGFAALATGKPDIVLLDLLLPDRHGLELMADLNDRFPSHPPVVILSNYGEPAMIDRGVSLGALEYLVKSRVTPALVSQSIPGWLEQAGRGSSESHN